MLLHTSRDTMVVEVAFHCKRVESDIAIIQVVCRASDCCCAYEEGFARKHGKAFRIFTLASRWYKHIVGHANKVTFDMYSIYK